MTKTKRLMGCAAAMAVSISLAGCANTARGVKSDAQNVAQAVRGGAETADVKAALIADGRVDATNINVDTLTDTKTVVLKGSVPSAEQRRIAEQIAKEQAKGYRVTNQLTVTAPRT